MLCLVSNFQMRGTVLRMRRNLRQASGWKWIQEGELEIDEPVGAWDSKCDKDSTTPGA